MLRACQPLATDRDAQDGGVDDSSLTLRYATPLATGRCAYSSSFGKRGTEKYRTANVHLRPVAAHPPPPKAQASPATSRSSTFDGQRCPDTCLPFGIQVPGSVKVKKSHHVCMYAAREADQARSSQAQGTALPVGRSHSFHDDPAIGTRSFSFYLHGEASATLPSSNPPV